MSHSPVNDGIAFFVPAYNEVGNVEHTTHELLQYLRNRNCPFQIILVNDGSLDGTAEACEMLAHRYPDEVTAVHHAANRGYGDALRTGLQIALDTGLAWIGFCDSDRQFHPRTSFDRLLAEVEVVESRSLLRHADAVVGYRNKRADGAIRLLTGRLWHWISGLVLDHDALDVDCGCKLFHRDMMVQIVPQLCGRYAATSPEIMAHLKRLGAHVTNVPVMHYPRENGSQTGLNLRVAAGSFLELAKVRVKMQRQTRAASPKLHAVSSQPSDSRVA
jgi:glycosyltransferase involved in cell wall biosynthesis